MVIFPLVVTRDNAVTAAYGLAELLQPGGVHPGQRVRPHGITQLIMSTLKRVPLYMGGIFPVQEKLGLERQGGQEQEQEQ